LPGWRRSTERARKLADLPDAASAYVQKLAELTGARLTIVSVGPSRAQTLML
jgi:adenylosuccinate synthase